ncbi:MAG: tetratricopeptide repeat protein [Nitrospina sp.]|nr:tetratricopeptide repeat protein [Nitrospina sp.]MBT5632711.1 tetratricopeptide repeat protein [Nitrospina sp.]
MKWIHSKSGCFRSTEAGGTSSLIYKVMVCNLQTKFLISLFFIVSLPLTSYAESVDSKIQKGITQYHEGQYKEAGENFTSAQTDRPEDTRLGYNLGNSLYKEKKFQEALETYTHSSLNEKDPDIRKNSIYNAGNTLVKLGKLKEAESAYKKALTLDAGDMDAKYNLEYVREQLKKKEEQKQDSDKDKNKNENSSSENEQGEDPEQNKDGKPHEENSPPPPENAESKEGDSGNSEESEENEKSAMEVSPEEAERMLKGLTEDLKSISRMQAGKTKSTYQGNDW